MAIQVLIRLLDGPPGSDREKGQFVNVKPVPNPGWGLEEGPPVFKVIEIEDLDFADGRVRRFIQRHHHEVDSGDGIGESKVVFSLRSRFQLDFTKLSPALQNKLANKEDKSVLKVQLKDVRTALRDRVVEERRARGRPDGD